MQLVDVRKGEQYAMPTKSMGGKDGWAMGTSKEAGLLIVLTPEEKNTGGVFISETELEKLGYVKR